MHQNVKITYEIPYFIRFLGFLRENKLTENVFGKIILWEIY